MMSKREQQDLWIIELYRWNSSIRLVGEFSKQRFVDQLLAEVIFVITKIIDVPWNTAIDIGSGNGLVSIPMAIHFTERKVIAMEPNQKKAVFLRHVKHVLKLNNFEVAQERLDKCRIVSTDNTLWTLRAMEITGEYFRNCLIRMARGRLLVFSSPTTRSERVVSRCQDILQEEEIFRVPGCQRNVRLLSIRGDVSRETW